MRDVRRMFEDLRLDVIAKEEDNMNLWRKYNDAGDEKAADAFVNRACECTEICKMIDKVLIKLRKEEEEEDDF